MYIHPTADDNEMHIYCTSSRGDLRALHSTASAPHDLASAFPSRNTITCRIETFAVVSSSLIAAKPIAPLALHVQPATRSGFVWRVERGGRDRSALGVGCPDSGRSPRASVSATTSLERTWKMSRSPLGPPLVAILLSEETEDDGRDLIVP